MMEMPPLVHIYQTSFGVVRLSPEFVEQAEKRWPGKYQSLYADCATGESVVRVLPKWDKEVFRGMERLMQRAYERGLTIRTIKSLDAITR